MKANTFTCIALVLFAIGLWSITSSARGVISDLRAGGTTSMSGGVFSTDGFQPAGTGVMSPFVRLHQQGNGTFEAGYNTSLGTPLQVVSGGQAWHTDLLLSSLAPVTVNGATYYDFRLDLNQSGQASKALLSLNQIQIFGASPSSAVRSRGVESLGASVVYDKFFGSSTFIVGNNPLP